jgi:SAM-dependent methyltransferase
VPLIFEEYAADLVARLAPRAPRRVLEVAAGTGVLTRAMAAGLPATSAIVATDLNQAMIDHAQTAGTARPVEWKQADAQQLPFEDGAFDAVVCQFGVMFVPDKPRAFAEARRVLAPGGIYLFNVWDELDTNEFADLIHEAVATVFPENPPRFLKRTPYGYYDVAAITRDLASAGFAPQPRVETVTKRSRASSPLGPALGYCQGTPLRGEIEARDPRRLTLATNTAAQAIAQRFGRGAVEAQIQAHVFTVER